MLRRQLSTLAPTIRHLLSQPPPPTESVTVNGWIRSIRKQKSVAFAVVSDGSTSQGLQAILSPEDVKGWTNGTAVRLQGHIVPSPGAGQASELRVDSGRIVGDGPCPEDNPIQKKALSVEHLRENVHLRARTAHMGSMMRFRDKLARGVGTWFDQQGFVSVHTPILTGNDAEGAGETFGLSGDFFGEETKAHLTVSHQLHLEAMAVGALGRVYSLSPCFRAERSQTARHLAEFWMLEAEWAFVNDVEDVCSVVEGLVRGVVDPLKDDPDMSLLRIGSGLPAEVDLGKDWARMTYTEAVDVLQKSQVKFEFAPTWGASLQSEHEKWLSEVYVGRPVFVTHYPRSLKPFYMRTDDADPRTAQCFDLLVPRLGELVGGSVREEREAVLRANMTEHGLDEEAYRWYLELRRWGGVEHAGFGMGFERLLGWLSGVDNVRECIPFPRWAGRMLL